MKILKDLTICTAQLPLHPLNFIFHFNVYIFNIFILTYVYIYYSNGYGRWLYGINKMKHDHLVVFSPMNRGSTCAYNVSSSN